MSPEGAEYFASDLKKKEILYLNLHKRMSSYIPIPTYL